VKYFSYAVVVILILAGILILLGYFEIDPNLRIIFGFIFIAYGIIRFFTVRWKHRRKNEVQNSGMEK